jgi:hypothetical protein
MPQKVILKWLLRLVIFCTASVDALAQQDSVIDDVGDMAFVGWSNSSQDGFAFVLMDDCPKGTAIKFIDEEWTGSSFYSTTDEGENTWTNTTGSFVSRGTVIIVQNADNNPTVNIGSVSETDAGFDLASSSPDQVFAIVGSRSSPTFIAMIGHTSLPDNGSGAKQTLQGTGLTTGSHAIHRTNEAIYHGSTACNGGLSNCLNMIYADSSWSNLSSTITFPASLVSNFGGSSLPVTLLSFNGSRTNNSNYLHWTTAQEINNAGFSIQRLENSTEWLDIGFEPGFGNSQNLNTYLFIDNDSKFESNKFYRLAQFDFDGAVYFSPTIRIRQLPNNTKPEIAWFSNSQGIFIDTEEMIEKLIVYNLVGQQIYCKDHVGSHAHFSNALFAVGQYVAVVTSENQVVRFRFEIGNGD